MIYLIPSKPINSDELQCLEYHQMIMIYFTSCFFLTDFFSINLEAMVCYKISFLEQLLNLGII